MIDKIIYERLKLFLFEISLLNIFKPDYIVLENSLFVVTIQ